MAPRPSEAKATTGPPPEGTLEAFPLPVLLTHVLAHRLSGSLVLKGTRGDDVIVFAEGSPTRVRTAKLVAPLGEMLVRLGVVADVDMQAALQRAQAANAKLGKQLVADSLIDRRVLLRALREQVLVRMRAVAAHPPETRYEFHPNTDLLEEAAPTNAVTCDPLAALLAVVRAWPDARRRDEVLDPLVERPMRLHANAAIDRFELDEQERAVIARIHTGTKLTYGDVLESSVAPERTIRALLYALVITGHADDGSGSPPLDVEPPLDRAAALRDSSLNTGVDPLRTSQAIRALGAADDHREAEALWKAGSLDAAEVLAARAVERDGKPEYRALLGVIVAQQGGRANYRRGLALLDRAIEENPNDDRTLVFRATVQRDAGKFDAAVRDWRAALAVNPKNAEARLALKRAESAEANAALRRSTTGGGASGNASWVFLFALIAATAALLVYWLRHR